MRWDHGHLRMAGALSALLCAACAHAHERPQGTVPAIGVERLYPLRPGAVWSYDVDTGEGLPTLAIARVLRVEQNRIEVSSGSETLVYELRPDGLYRSDLGSYVLRTPIAQGAHFQGPEGAEITVTDVAKTVVSPAGTFVGCVETRSNGGASPKNVRTVFCPDVGPVEIESSLPLTLTGKAARVHARLRGYDLAGSP